MYNDKHVWVKYGPVNFGRIFHNNSTFSCCRVILDRPHPNLYIQSTDEKFCDIIEQFFKNSTLNSLGVKNDK